MKKLSDCKSGSWWKVEKIDNNAPIKIKRRLLEFGFTGGQGVRVERKSIFGDTFLIQIRGYCLSLRKRIVEYIWVVK